jgi:hypothetical protein
VRFSALHAIHPWLTGRLQVLIPVRAWVDPRVIMLLEGLDQLKKFNNLIRNQTRDLLACSIVPQLAMLPHVSCIEEHISSISEVNVWTACLRRLQRSGKSWMFLWCTLDFMKPQAKKSYEVKSWEPTTQGLGPPCPLHQFGKQLLRYSWTFKV